VEPLSPVAISGQDGDGGRSEAGVAGVAISAIVPMFQDRSDVVEVYEAYKAAIETLGRPYELIYVLGWRSERALAALQRLKQRDEGALVLVVGQQVDEAEALLSGFERARGEIVLTLPPDLQVEPADPSLVGETVLLGSRSVEIAQLVRVYSPDGITGHGTFSTLAAPDGPPHPLGGPAPFYLVVATAVEVHLDRETGQVVIDKVVHGTDAGKVINVRRARRVDEGGIVMGQSLALSEGLVFDESGRLMNGSSLDYRIATVADMPDEMSELYLENGDGPGPFGAKGLAEGAILAIGPAIAGAILDLTGVHLTRIPMTPERVWAALQETSAVREPVAV